MGTAVLAALTRVCPEEALGTKSGVQADKKSEMLFLVLSNTGRFIADSFKLNL